MKHSLLVLAGIALLFAADEYRIDQLNLTYGGGSTTDGTYTLELVGTSIAGQAASTSYEVVLGPMAAYNVQDLDLGVLTVSAVGDRLVTLQWEDDVLADFPKASIEVLRSTEATSGFGAVETLTSGTSYTDRTVQNGHLYYYKVQLKSGSTLGPETAVRMVIPTASLARGDVDGDGDTDGSDLVLIAYASGLTRTDTGFLPSADIDGNGTVENADIDTLLTELGYVRQ